MKVDKSERTAEPAPQPRKSFKEVAQAPGPKRTPPRAPSTKRAAAPIAVSQPGAIRHQVTARPHRVADALQLARAQMNADAGRATLVRGESVGLDEQRSERRMLDLIVRELKDDRLPARAREVVSAAEHPEPLRAGDSRAEAPSAKVDAASARTSQGAPAAEASPVPRTAAIAELVEKIRVFVKDSRPAMAMSVKGSLNARVEIERAGPGAVALKIVGDGRRPRAEELAQLRDELERRGIRIASLSVGG